MIQRWASSRDGHSSKLTRGLGSTPIFSGNQPGPSLDRGRLPVYPAPPPELDKRVSLGLLRFYVYPIRVAWVGPHAPAFKWSLGSYSLWLGTVNSPVWRNPKKATLNAAHIVFSYPMMPLNCLIIWTIIGCFLCVGRPSLPRVVLTSLNISCSSGILPQSGSGSPALICSSLIADSYPFIDEDINPWSPRYVMK